MAWHWRITTLPELAPLSPAARRKVVRHGSVYCWSAKLLRLVWILTAVLFLAFYRVAAGLVRPRAVEVALAVTLVCGWLVVGYGLYVARVRAGVRRWLREDFPDGRFRSCPQCGYDLYGSRGETCPECGEATRLADEGGRARSG